MLGKKLRLFSVKLTIKLRTPLHKGLATYPMVSILKGFNEYAYLHT